MKYWAVLALFSVCENKNWYWMSRSNEVQFFLRV